MMQAIKMGNVIDLKGVLGKLNNHVNKHDNRFFSALHYAAWSNNSNIVKLLLDHPKTGKQILHVFLQLS